MQTVDRESSVLIDTNILVYAYDIGEPRRRERAIKVLRQLHAQRAGWLSVQCLAEFFSTMTRGSNPRLRPGDALDQVELMSRAWPVFALTPMISVEAARGVRDHQLSYWDAQLWATARLNQVPQIYSEDFSTGESLEGVRFDNPLRDDFITDGA